MPRQPISIVIRNLNERPTLEILLRVLKHQTHPPDQIVLVDNESTDGSVEMAKPFGVEVTSVRRGGYHPGAALNQGIRLCRNEIVGIISAHSIPMTRDFLAIVVDAFNDDRIAALRLLEAPRSVPRADPLVSHRLEPGAPLDIINRWGLNNPASALRRSVWERVPFDEAIEACEDKLWTVEVLKLGYVLAPCSAVSASVRTRTPREGMLRNYRQHLVWYKMSGQLPETSIAQLARGILGGCRLAAEHVWCAVMSYWLCKRIPATARRNPLRALVSSPAGSSSGAASEVAQQTSARRGDRN